PCFGSGVARRRGSAAVSRRLRFRARIRHRAQVARDAAVSGGADLDQSSPRLFPRACAWDAEIVMESDVRDRSQRSDVRDQMSEIRSQRSGLSYLTSDI